MRELITCPRSRQKSSKRLIALVFCAAAVFLSLVLACLIVFRPNMDVDLLKLLASTIGIFALASGGTQATTMSRGQNTSRDENYEPKMSDGVEV